MSYSNATGEPTHPSDAGPAGAAFATSWVARTGAVPRNSRKIRGTVGNIAMDAAKVSLAGALISKATHGSDVRFEKVALLQQAIAAGTYRVSSASLAEKLIGALLK